MPDPFIGEIRMVGFNYAPQGWALCNGQLLSIQQNTALFSLLGTTFGGDGRTTFGLPDLRGRVPMHQGQGPGLSSYQMGEKGGVESMTLSVSNMPQHFHTVSTTAKANVNLSIPANSNEGDTDVPGNNKVLAKMSKGLASVNGYTSAPANTQLQTQSETVDIAINTPTTATGGNIPVDVLQPYQVVNFIIALEGIFPSRS
jgi:microcystin-dependent protein